MVSALTVALHITGVSPPARFAVRELKTSECEVARLPTHWKEM
jgi:hypothetical protein